MADDTTCPDCGMALDDICYVCLYDMDDTAGRETLVTLLGGRGNPWEEDEEAQEQAAQAALDLLLADNLDTLEQPSPRPPLHMFALIPGSRYRAAITSGSSATSRKRLAVSRGMVTIASWPVGSS